MAIEYVEIRDSNTDVIGIIDVAKSIIWHSVYFGVGDFEIYAEASPEVVALLQAGNYVTRPDDLEVGIIEAIDISENAQDGMMVTATGRFAKSILDRRLIYSLSGSVNAPTILRGNVETEVRRVVYENAIACTFDSRRNIPILALGDVAGIPLKIVDAEGKAAQKQVSYRNLLEYTDEVLAEYGLAATVILDEAAKKLRYVIYAGTDHSTDNTAGNEPIVFSKDYDNLENSSYQYNAATEKNVALIGGEGEGVNRFYSLVAGTQTGLQRREMWVDASSINKTFKDGSDIEQTYSDEDYKAMLDAAGVQNLAQNVVSEVFDGTMDITNSPWLYNRDFALGDIVTMQSNDIGKYINVRLREVLEVQDENGYAIQANNQA